MKSIHLFGQNEEPEIQSQQFFMLVRPTHATRDNRSLQTVL